MLEQNGYTDVVTWFGEVSYNFEQAMEFEYYLPYEKMSKEY
jgi:hypothetical protein